MRTPALGRPWEARRLLAVLAVVALTAGMVLLYGGVALAGDEVPAHVPECEDTTTTTVEDTTTTTVEDTTTTTVEDTTTTTVEDTTTSTVEDTTTTTVEDTTTSTVEDTTTTTVEDTTTTTVEDTTTTTAEVLPTVVTTAPDEVDDDELPFTGMDTDVMIGLAVVLLGVGATVLAMTRKVAEK